MDKQEEWTNAMWRELFDDRQRDIIDECEGYAKRKKPGLPGHMLMLVVAEMAALLDKAAAITDSSRPFPPAEV